jgi:hypothetical protein
MHKRDIVIGRTYIAKVSGKLTRVTIIGESPYGGWNAVNTATKRDVRIRGCQRLRRECLAPGATLPGGRILGAMFQPCKCGKRTYAIHPERRNEHICRECWSKEHPAANAGAPVVERVGNFGESSSLPANPGLNESMGSGAALSELGR